MFGKTLPLLWPGPGLPALSYGTKLMITYHERKREKEKRKRKKKEKKRKKEEKTEKKNKFFRENSHTRVMTYHNLG